MLPKMLINMLFRCPAFSHSLLSRSCCGGQPPPPAGGPRLRLRLAAHQATERGPAKQRAAGRQARQVGGEEGGRDGSCGLGLARRKQQRRQPGQLTCNTTTTTNTFSPLHSPLLVLFLTPPPLLHPPEVPNGENSISFFTFCQMAHRNEKQKSCDHTPFKRPEGQYEKRRIKKNKWDREDLQRCPPWLRPPKPASRPGSNHRTPTRDHRKP